MESESNNLLHLLQQFQCCLRNLQKIGHSITTHLENLPPHCLEFQINCPQPVVSPPPCPRSNETKSCPPPINKAKCTMGPGFNRVTADVSSSYQPTEHNLTPPHSSFVGQGDPSNFMCSNNTASSRGPCSPSTRPPCSPASNSIGSNAATHGSMCSSSQRCPCVQPSTPNTSCNSGNNSNSWGSTCCNTSSNPPTSHGTCDTSGSTEVSAHFRIIPDSDTSSGRTCTRSGNSGSGATGHTSGHFESCESGSTELSAHLRVFPDSCSDGHSSSEGCSITSHSNLLQAFAQWWTEFIVHQLNSEDEEEDCLASEGRFLCRLEELLRQWRSLFIHRSR